MWSIPAFQDATIYEMDPYRNTGLDQILELRKQGDSTTSDLKESRILIKFDLDTLSSVLTSNSISINDVTASLKLFTVQESALPKSYSIQAKLVADEWENGSGYLTYPAGLITQTAVTDGATWNAVAGTGSLNWVDTSTVSAEYEYATTSGGGTWYTGSTTLKNVTQSQTFTYSNPIDLDVDVTNTVDIWFSQSNGLGGDIPNEGFIIKQTSFAGLIQTLLLFANEHINRFAYCALRIFRHNALKT